MSGHRQIVQVEEYERFVGAETVQRVKEKARALRGLRVAHVNSTYYGGGVAEMLAPLTLLMNSLGIKTEWRVIQGSPDFFSITKKMHNALQGGDINLSKLKREIYECVVYENSIRNDLDHDRIVVHDPQPLPLINHYEKKGPWVWRCHVDLTSPNGELWSYLCPFIEKYDAVIVTLEEYA
ncbi:MAG: glycosyl transferase family 1, partial [Anaerolineae bacterium]|nr:glycosyl transferase family 1 [Anaerolineae bacterium]